MMTRAQFKKQLERGLNAVFGLEYKRHPEQWRKMFSVESSDQAFEEDVLMAGLGGAAIKPEGQAVQYDEGGEAWTARYTHNTIALAFALTEEAMEDNLYGKLGSKYSKSLARALQHTKELRHADTFNNGFDTDFTGGDGKPLYATDHPLWEGGSFANKLSTAADLSESSLEEAEILVQDMVDERNIPVDAQIEKLQVPTNLKHVARRILMSDKRSGTADNDINSVREDVAEYCVNVRLTDTDAWFLKTDVPDGLKHMVRKKVQRGVEGDFETGNMRYKARERYAEGWTNPRGSFASEGAG